MATDRCICSPSQPCWDVSYPRSHRTKFPQPEVHTLISLVSNNSTISVEYCPVVTGSEVITERWNLLIVREILIGTRRFNEIHRGLPGLSRTMLSQRLRTLQHLGLIEHKDSQYWLTASGKDLRPVIEAIGNWAVKWRFPAPESAQVIDAVQFARHLYSGLVLERLPQQRVTVELMFESASAGTSHAWLVSDGKSASFCTKYPRFDVDLYAIGQAKVWNEVWFGFRTFEHAIRDDDLRLLGDNELAQQFPSWFRLSPFSTKVAEHHSNEELRHSA